MAKSSMGKTVIFFVGAGEARAHKKVLTLLNTATNPDGEAIAATRTSQPTAS
jgi:hypothetical protein